MLPRRHAYAVILRYATIFSRFICRLSIFFLFSPILQQRRLRRHFLFAAT